MDYHHLCDAISLSDNLPGLHSVRSISIVVLLVISFLTQDPVFTESLLVIRGAVITCREVSKANFDRADSFQVVRAST